MKTSSLIPPLLFLVLVSCLPAAETVYPKRVTAILEVEARDVDAYVQRISDFNASVKSKVKKDTFIRVFQTTFDSKKSGHLRVVTDAPSITELSETAELVETELRSLRRELDPARTTSARVLYQAVRVDGSGGKGGANYTTCISMTDEKGYMTALNSLRTILDANGMKDIRISLYRAIAGRSEHTHLAILGAPTIGRLSEFLDFIATNEKAAEWIASSAKYRTVVSNFVARDITK